MELERRHASVVATQRAAPAGFLDQLPLRPPTPLHHRLLPALPTADPPTVLDHEDGRAVDATLTLNRAPTVGKCGLDVLARNSRTLDRLLCRSRSYFAIQ